MRSETIKENWMLRLFYLLLLISYFSLLISLTACGRRGDPAAISPYDNKIDEKDIAAEKKSAGNSESAVIHNKKTEDDRIDEDDKIELTIPDPPAGLAALYTQKDIILVWDEIRWQGVKTYNIYRSGGDDYRLVGDSIIPAFIDSNVKRDTRYFYRVTAVGVLESRPSKEISILTEVH